MTSRPSADDFRGQTPTYWVMDLTPPEEWDVVPDWPDPLSDIRQAIQVMGQQLGKSFQQAALPFVTAGSALHATAERIAVVSGLSIAHVATVIDQWTPVVNDLIDLNGMLVRIDEEKNGTYTVVPYKNLGLPTRKTNTGPPINPHARGGRGGRR